MCLFVTGIGALIHLYAIGYMHGDPKFSKFFLYLNLFAFCMLMLVLGENLLVTFLGWEGVGTCSYLLIAFWHDPRQRGHRRQEGVRHQPRRRLGLHDRDVPRLPGDRHARATSGINDAAETATGQVDGHRRSPCCCSSAPAARAPSCRCTSGCPTRWKARRRCRR